MALGERMKESRRELAIGLSRLDGVCAGDCGRFLLSPGIIGDSRTIGWYIGVVVTEKMECILC